LARWVWATFEGSAGAGLGFTWGEVIDGHWLRKAAMDHQWAGLTFIGSGAMSVGRHSKGDNRRTSPLEL
jgi:hypothetical protein